MIEGTITTTDDVRLYYRTLGSGDKTILVPNGLYLLEDFRFLADECSVFFYDLRNRGQSDTIHDPAKLARGIEQDVDDLETVRRHVGANQVDVIGHSYVGLMVGLYAMKYSSHVGRVVQIGPPPPDDAKTYPSHLTGADETFAQVMAEVGRMMKDPPPGTPEEVCRKFWSVLRLMYVIRPEDAGRVDWGRCELENERTFMRYWVAHIRPSIQKLHLTPEEFGQARMPVLIVHGRKDRNAPYGGARDWAMQWPNARLLTVENAAHAPWIDQPGKVLEPLNAFFAGQWPEAAEEVKSL